MIRALNLFLISICMLVSGCATTPGNTKTEKRQAVKKMSSDVLTQLYESHPEAKKEIRKSAGYAVFSNVSANVIFVGVGGGYGVVIDNKKHSKTYMKMGEVGLGIGLGAKDFRAVFIFEDKETMDYFIEKGWTFGGQADAAAKSGDKGKAISGEVVVKKIKIYQITESGISLQATVKGTKYWKDDELN
ncbi:MAG: hypothetical protein D6B27_10235 [Gammaproteobacteria bacterium]|nr:MAG: hypothetical protein D6B27_10235 [Gammaproteobacteria bacterium]